ncbi:MAG: transcription antitermination factor NusB, partial [Candidatus Coatesbacteria bacterium]|nr:transcription antitermination factor NusB [Candidatus Coatesbacteria bacterium]
MGNRHRAREIAIMLLYQHEATGIAIDRVLEDYFNGHPVNPDTKRFAEELVSGTASHIKDIDVVLERTSEHWSLERILPVDLAIIRLAAFEIIHFGTAPAIAINEAVCLAKRYSSDKASSFINGVLD